MEGAGTRPLCWSDALDTPPTTTGAAIMSEELLALAARCEAATGPDRELELAIWQAVFPETYPPTGHAPLEWLGCYTRSIDIAMTLVPEGLTWRLDNLRSRHGQRSVGSAVVLIDGTRFNGDAATPANALCAAALRARAVSHRDDERRG